VFLSFPHISVDAHGTIGEISRPGRPGQSCACGALAAALGDIKSGGLRANCKKPGGALAPLLQLPHAGTQMSFILHTQTAVLYAQAVKTSSASCVTFSKGM
jgi:hypothetical protein